MTQDSAPDLLVLHAVRIMGFADTRMVARRFGLDATKATEVLEDAEARGWVQHAAFANLGGWSLRESGRAENERQLAAELARAGCIDVVRAVYGEFLPLNALVQRACTDWQLRPTSQDRLAVNDHSDPTWDGGVLDELVTIDRTLGPLADRLGNVLTRFRGYDKRFTLALQRARAGEAGWVDRTDIDSCHRVWFELHEDLIATLGLNRHTQP